MDRRTLVSAAALLGFVLMLVGTSKPRPSSSGPTPAPMPTPAGLDAGAGGGGGGGAANLGPQDASAPSSSADAGRTPKVADAGATSTGPASRLELPPLWGDVGVPPGGRIDAVRLVYAGADAADVQSRLIAALSAKGWTLAQGTDPLAPPGSAKPLTFSRRGQRLAVRVTAQDDAVIVSLNLL